MNKQYTTTINAIKTNYRKLLEVREKVLKKREK